MIEPIEATELPLCYSGFPVSQQNTIQEAISILENRLHLGDVFASAVTTKQFCQLQLAAERDEVFCCLYLNSQHHLIAFRRHFQGTIDSASVYPRVVVRTALELNAAAVIFTHNHPSGITEPSRADIAITSKLKEALSLIDVRTLDHIVVGTEDTTSMAERGLI